MGAPSADSALFLSHHPATANGRSFFFLPGASEAGLASCLHYCLSYSLQVLETRSSVYSKLCRIHGKLGLMNIHEPEAPAGELVAEPLVSVTLGGEWVWSQTSDDVMFYPQRKALGLEKVQTR